MDMIILLVILACLVGMAKVDGPLFSLEAKGKIGDAMVFFPWKGRHAVRRWLKPTNPRDIDQKIMRQKLAGIGKCIGAITTPGATLPNGAAFVVAMKVQTPAAQIWNAYTVKKAMEDLSDDGNFTALSAAIFGTDTVAKWREMATTLGLDTLLSTADAFATDISPELQLAMAAYAAYKVELSDATNTYNTYPSFMTTGQIEGLAHDFTAAY